jgi:hypothetical protein
MKLRAPPWVCGPIVVKGREVDIAEDGSLVVPDAEASALAAHGFAPFEDAPPPTMSLAAQALVAADADLIGLMSPVELFAFLRARGVVSSLPIRNDGLRAMARAALGREPAR